MRTKSVPAGVGQRRTEFADQNLVKLNSHWLLVERNWLLSKGSPADDTHDDRISRVAQSHRVPTNLEWFDFEIGPWFPASGIPHFSEALAETPRLPQ